MNHKDAFEKYVSEARSFKMSGWNFEILRDRMIEEKPPWDFAEIAKGEIRKAESLLDIGTGGGEFLSSLAPLPKLTLATEGYHPNVRVARDQLRTLGVDVVGTYSEDNTSFEQRGALPFRTESIEIVLDRHESFIAKEVFRILKKQGRFLTQQVGTRNLIQLNELLEAPMLEGEWGLPKCKKQILDAGFELLSYGDARMITKFKDIGAVMIYLLAAPWQIPDFEIEKYRSSLKRMNDKIEKEGALAVESTRFYVRAVKV